MALALLFDSNLQFQYRNGAVLIGGILRVYYNSTTDKVATTYSDAAGIVRNPEDIILDSNGRATVSILELKIAVE